jgi:hypothetical protein
MPLSGVRDRDVVVPVTARKASNRQPIVPRPVRQRPEAAVAI